MGHFVLAFLGLGMLLSGCGDQLTSEAQKAIEIIKLEASKAAIKTIDDTKTEALARLKKVSGLTEKNDPPQEKSDK